MKDNKHYLDNDSIKEIFDGIPEEIIIKHRAFCVWETTDLDASKEIIITKNARSYGTTYEDAMKYKNTFIHLYEQDELYEEMYNTKVK